MKTFTRFHGVEAGPDGAAGVGLLAREFPLLHPAFNHRGCPA